MKMRSLGRRRINAVEENQKPQNGLENCVVVIENSLRFLKPMLSQDSSIYEASLFGGFKLRAYSGKGVSRPTTKPEIAYIP